MTDNQIFEPDGRAIPYAVVGDGPALVLIAGQGLNVTYLSTLAGAVAAEDFRVLRIGSRRPPREADATVSINDLGQDVVDVMDHLSVADAWVGGHAFSGSVARVVSQLHPERVNGVLLLGVEGATQATNPPDVTEIPEHWRDAEVVSMLSSVREAAATPATLVPGIPVLVIQGTEDRVAPLANGEGLQASAPDRVSVVRIEGGGHMFPATHVGETSWAIEDYLDWD
jgi:pimeloyl-ACP methyl ester carboxylesterase